MLLFAVAALTALGATACGGEIIAVKTVTAQGVTSVVEERPGSTTDTRTDPPDPLNPQSLEKELEAGECDLVASQTAEVLATSESKTPATVAEAHLYHALADACLGNNATAELDQAEASRTLLSDGSVKILDRVRSEGVPQTPAEVQDVLPVRTIATEP